MEKSNENQPCSVGTTFDINGNGMIMTLRDWRPQVQLQLILAVVCCVHFVAQHFKFVCVAS